MTGKQKSLAEEFLLKEYENAAQVTFHADEFRDKLSTFFLTFAGAALAAVVLLLKGTFTVDVFGDKSLTAGAFLIGVSIIGLLILCIHARLRRVQLEHFAIISRIRIYCLRNDVAVWNAIRLSPNTLPNLKLRKWSGSELWALTILLPAVVLFATGVDFLLRWLAKHGCWHLLPVIIGILSSWLLWKLYIKLALAPVHQPISQEQTETWLKEYGFTTDKCVSASATPGLF